MWGLTGAPGMGKCRRAMSGEEYAKQYVWCAPTLRGLSEARSAVSERRCGVTGLRTRSARASGRSAQAQREPAALAHVFVLTLDFRGVASKQCATAPP